MDKIKFGYCRIKATRTDLRSYQTCFNLLLQVFPAELLFTWCLERCQGNEAVYHVVFSIGDYHKREVNFEFVCLDIIDRWNELVKAVNLPVLDNGIGVVTGDTLDEILLQYRLKHN